MIEEIQDMITHGNIAHLIGEPCEICAQLEKEYKEQFIPKTIGLSYVSYWGDQVEDVACGHSIFLTDLILALDKKRYQIFALQKDLDEGAPLFQNFMVEKRDFAYGLQNFDDGFPELDILLLEWRWKIEGRNWMADGSKPPMDDYIRQEALLDHYCSVGTKVFILDTDYKLTKEDEERWPEAHILDLASKSKELSRKRTGVFWPFDMAQLTERVHCVHFPISDEHTNSYPVDPTFLISYIGNDYERDTQFKKYIGDVAELLGQGTVHVYGNWLKYPEKAVENYSKYPYVTFHPKVTKAHMEYIYSRSLCVPLLSKDDYAEHGQIAYRILEVMYNGGIPVGLKEFYNVEKYVIPELIVRSSEELVELIEKLSKQTARERVALWDKQINHFKYSAEEFINVLETI